MLSASQQTRLNHQHESIPEMTKGFTEQALRVRPENGKWSAYENIAHLASYQPRFIERLKRIEKEESPLFERYVGDSDPAFFECCEMDYDQLNEHLFTQRFILLNYSSSLNETSLLRIGRHPVFGDLAIPAWIEFFLLHEAHHLFTIFKLLNHRQA
jgi:hypothetical protein